MEGTKAEVIGKSYALMMDEYRMNEQAGSILVKIRDELYFADSSPPGKLTDLPFL